jgi:hypothetical protein
LAAKRFNIKFFSHTYLQPYRNIVRTIQYSDRSKVATNAGFSARQAELGFIAAATTVQPESRSEPITKVLAGIKILFGSRLVDE